MSSPKNILDVPLEIRSIIYTAYFQGLVVTYPSLTPPLLLTSRRIRNETRPYFYKHATFDLVDTEHLVDYMCTIPGSTIAALRHIRFGPRLLRFSKESVFRLAPDVSQILARCDGLQLDTLEIKQYNKPLPDPLALPCVYMSAGYILDLLRANAGFKHLVFGLGQSQWSQQMLEQLLLFFRPNFTLLYRLPGDIGCQTSFKVARCITDKGDDCAEKNWREQTGQTEETWKALHKPIYYGLRVTRDAISDTVNPAVRREGVWTLQDLRQEMDKSLVVNVRGADDGIYVETLGRGKFCRDVIIDIN